MKRIISLTMVIVFLVSISSVAFAASGITPYASQIFSQLGSHISYSGGKVLGVASVNAWVVADKLGMSSIALYEGTSSGGWSKIASASGKYGYDTRSYNYTISANATTGKEYKFVVTFYGKDGSVTDSLTHTKYSTN